ncbi:MAG: hypothetical protein KIT48_17105 [Pseudolabrys sp.]|nr:hypothetical protein [Pseudolabrys sp.]
MTRMRVCLAALILASGAILTPVVAQQTPQQPADSQCANRDAIPDLRSELSKIGASVDSVNIPDGVAVVITTSNATKANVAAMEDAVRGFYGDEKQLRASGGSCPGLRAAITAGKVQQAVTQLSNGLLLTVTSRDDVLVKAIKDNNCCSWCVCNTPCSHTCCSSCC